MVKNTSYCNSIHQNPLRQESYEPRAEKNFIRAEGTCVGFKVQPVKELYIYYLYLVHSQIKKKKLPIHLGRLENVLSTGLAELCLL